MCTIRRAAKEDIDAMLALGAAFFGFSRFAEFVPFDPAGARASVASCVDSGIAFVAEQDGLIIGGIIGVLCQVWFSPNSTTAAELGWWVDEDYRGSMAGVRLLRAFESAAKDAGAIAVSMSDLSAGGTWPAGKLFEKLGYTVVERCQMKRIN